MTTTAAKFLTKRVYYTYRAVSGDLMPASSAHHASTPEGAMQHLEAMHAGSVTPVVEVFPLLQTKDEIQTRINQLQKQLLDTPEKETGLRHSLRWVIKYLQIELLQTVKEFKATAVEILTKGCEQMGLAFDLNVRKCPNRNAWKAYLRAKGTGNEYLREAWLKSRIANKMVFLLQDLGFVSVRVEGGCADLGCFIEVSF